ncbi:hypothetical protein ACFQ7J_14205 [Streptomyces sp. NPDC056501]|uniref:hypothetical protein n=1 Tax=Streptomyces sp. NPDC056501 TaxID=3345841 RepID=UPI0036BE7504
MTPASTPDPDTGPGIDAANAANAANTENTGVEAEAEAEIEAEVDRIREAFAREAYDVTPSPVPLAALRREGRKARRRRRTATFSALTVLGAATAAAAVVGVMSARPPLPAPAPIAAPPSAVAPRVPTPKATPTSAKPTPTPVRVVASGQRVDAGKGWKVWLTAEGKHWTGPDGLENSRSVTDGNVDTATPGVTHQSETSPAGGFHSGLYYGTRAVGRVELRGPGGTRTAATLLELPGRPGWGVWYAHAGPGAGKAGLAMYDRAGKLLAELPG